MKNKMWFNVIMTIVGILFILSFAVTVVLYFRPLYYHDIKSLDIESHSGYNEEEIRENYDVLIDYNTFFGPDKLQFPTLPMSEPAEIHFEEVKHILLFFQYGLMVSLPLLIIGFILSRKWNLFGWMRYADMALATLVVLVVGYMAIDWDGFFVFFHKLMFRNDYWFFDYETDPIILMLPDEFFMHFGILMIVIVVVEMLLFWFGDRIFRKKEMS